jgi:hypothetical protein
MLADLCRHVARANGAVAAHTGAPLSRALRGPAASRPYAVCVIAATGTGQLREALDAYAR